MSRTFVALALLLHTTNAGHGQEAARELRVPADHPTIQTALDAARPGDRVVVAPGTYRERVVLRERVTLRSAGDDTAGAVGLKRAEATVLDAGGAAKGPAVTLAEGAVLDGFTVTGVGSFDAKEYERHHAERGENLPDGRGAVGDGGEVPAVAVFGVTAVVRDNVVRDNSRPGIGCTAGVGKRNASLVVRNVCHHNMGSGIGVADGAGPVVEANRCYHNLRSGIGVRSSAGVLVGNECFDNVRAGIGIREGARPVVRGNRCHGNRRAGIGCRMDGTAPLIEDNDCSKNGLAGIGCSDGAAPVVRKNRCHENERAGIGFDEGKGGTAVVADNRVFDNGEVAVDVHAGWKVRLTGNELSRKDGLPPVVMVFKGAEADLTDNTISGVGVAGVRAEGVVRVVGNRFECPAARKAGPPQSAVWGLLGSEVTVVGNTMTGYWQPAVRLNQPATAVVTGNVFRTESAQPPVSVTGGAAVVENNRVEKPAGR